MQIRFHDMVKLSLKNRRYLKAFVPYIFFGENVSAESLDVIFCSDEFILKLNQQALQHDSYTDIISFQLSEDNSKPVIGELYISIDRVKENAQNYKVSLKEELHRVIFHGILHLCGYQDKRKKDIFLMRQKEQYYLNEYFSKCSTWNITQ